MEQDSRGMLVNRIRRTRKAGPMPIERCRDLAVQAWFRNCFSGDEAEEAIKRTAFNLTHNLAIELRADRWAAMRERRALGDNPMSTTGAEGGYLAAADFHTLFEEALVQTAPFLAVCDVAVTLTGSDYSVATVDDSAADGSVIAINTVRGEEAAVAVGQRVLKAYFLTSQHLCVPFELMQDSVQFQAFLPRMLGNRVGRLIGSKCTVGTGVAEPRGILLDATAVPAASATAVSRDELLTLMAAVDSAYRSPLMNPCWMMHPNTILVLAKIIDGDGRVYFPDVLGPTPMLLGYPVLPNPSMPTMAAGNRAILFGAMKSFKIRAVGDVEVARSGGSVIRTVQRSETRAEYDQELFQAFVRLDSGLADPSGTAVACLQMAAA